MEHQIQYKNLQGFRTEQVFASCSKAKKKLIISVYSSLRGMDCTYIIRKSGTPDYSTTDLKKAVDKYNS